MRDQLVVEFSKVGAGAETPTLIRVNHHGLGPVGAITEVGRQRLKLTQGRQADLVSGLAVKGDLKDVACSSPGQRLALKEGLRLMLWRPS